MTSEPVADQDEPALALAAEPSDAAMDGVRLSATLAAPVVIAEASAQHGKARAASGLALASAVLLHVAAFLAVTAPWADQTAEIGGGRLEAINVEIVSAEEIDARASAASAGAQSAVAATPAAAAPLQTPKTEPDQLPRADTPPDPPAPLADDPGPAPLPPKLAEQPPAKPAFAPNVESPVVNDPPASTPAQTADASLAGHGGAGSAGSAAIAVQQSGAAAATPGELRAFAQKVAQALGKSKPRKSDAKGEVRLSFTVSDAGRPDAVQVTRSSGSPALDEAARQALMRAEFPSPPQGMTLVQRTYEVPYQFR